MQILIACFQLLLPLLIERNLQGTLNAVSGNHTRKTHGNTAQTVFSVQHNRGGNDCTFRIIAPIRRQTLNAMPELV